MTTLGTFPLTESRTGYVHTQEGVKHVSSVFSAKLLAPKHQTRPWNEGHRFGSYLKIGDK
jgi:hypothetical protein